MKVVCLILTVFLGLCFSPLLAQSIICVDAGHGGSDPGAVGQGLQEKNINLDVANRFYTALKNAGYKPYMTRSNDSTVSLASRANYANSLGAHRFISVHCNAFNGSANGTETFCYPGVGGVTQRLRDKTNPLVVQALNTYNRGCKTADFYVLRCTDMPAILCELAFIDNAGDAAKLGDAYYRQRAAEALLGGVQQAGREAEAETEDTTRAYLAPRWSPDGSNLLVTTSGYQGLYLVSLAERKVQKLTGEKRAGYQAHWISTHEIQYQVQNDQNKSQFAVTLDGVRSKSENRQELITVWAQEGAIWVEKGTEKRCLSDGKDIYFNPVLSPDKTIVVYESLTTGLHATPIQGDKKISLGKGNNPSWTPDSNQIVCDISEDDGQVITASDLWLIPVYAPNRRINLTQEGSFCAQRATISPDGKKIAFDARGKIYVAEIGEHLIKNCQEISVSK